MSADELIRRWREKATIAQERYAARLSVPSEMGESVLMLGVASEWEAFIDALPETEERS